MNVDVVTLDKTKVAQLVPGIKIFDNISDLPESDILIIATPLSEYEEVTHHINAKNHKIITDVGSIKTWPEKTMHNFNNFVGSHPIAGAAFSGAENSEEGLFNKKIIVTTKNNLDLIKFWSLLGGNMVIMSPQEHDRIYGKLSHFIHLLSFSFAKMIDTYDDSIFLNTYPEYKEFRRISFASRDIWVGKYGIFNLNKDNIKVALNEFIELSKNIKHTNIVDLSKQISVVLEQMTKNEDKMFFTPSIKSMFAILQLNYKISQNNKEFDISDLFVLMKKQLNDYL